MDLHKTEEEQVPDVDWAKVGKLYNQETTMDAVMEREFARLNKALDAKLILQDEKML